MEPMAASRPGEIRIGHVLSEARARAGLEIREVEAETKIRVKYLQALEDEQWDVLPSTAYAKGFLRTYAELLGLDGDALVDEFRRQVESGGGDDAYPLGDQVLEPARRMGAGPGGPSPWLLAGLAVVAIAAVLLVIGLTGGDDGGKGRGEGHPGRAAKKHDRKGGEGPEPSGTVKLALEVLDPVQICLLGGGGEELIDGQVLAAGTSEEYERRQMELRFPSGFASDQLKIEIAGKRRILPKADGPAAYRLIAPKRVRQIAAPGQECP